MTIKSGVDERVDETRNEREEKKKNRSTPFSRANYSNRKTKIIFLSRSTCAFSNIYIYARVSYTRLASGRKLKLHQILTHARV